MQIEALLKSFIYLIAGSLFIPTLILLCLILIWLLFSGGGFFSEWLHRRRTKAPSPDACRQTIKGENKLPGASGPIHGFVENLCGLLDSKNDLLEAEMENLLQKSVQALYKPLDYLKLVIRIGPGLGLIGTLIPMGTGLAALGQGDLTQLSADLVIAFTTTVLGLSEGMAAYFLLTVKRRWVQEDVRTIEFLTEMAFQLHSKEAPGEDRPCGS